MFELAARSILAVLALASALTLKRPDPQLTAAVFVVFLGYSGVAYVLETRDQRNSGLSGIIAALDACCISLLLSQSGLLGSYGFVVLVPLLWAVTRHQADSLNMAPLVAGTVMVGSNLFGGPGFTAPMLVQTAGILAIGLLADKAGSAKQTRHPAQTAAVETRALESVATHVDPELRESYQALREHTLELEKRSRKDRSTVLIYDAGRAADEPAFDNLARTMMEVTDAEGVILYTANDLTRSLVPQSCKGAFPSPAQGLPLEIFTGLGDGQLRHKLEKQLLAWRGPESSLQVGSLTIKHKGRIVGMLALFHGSVKILDQVVERASESMETLTRVMLAHVDSEDRDRRLREAEILYHVATTAAGADTPNALAARVVRELTEVLRLDQVGVFFLTNDGRADQVAAKGPQVGMIDVIRFPDGDGVKGWLETGGEELVLSNAYTDEHLPEKEGVRRRVGSYAVLPIQFGEEPYGFVTVAMQKVDGLDKGRLEGLRALVAELGSAIDRLANPSGLPHGMMTPKEFSAAVAADPKGCLVYLDLLKKEDLVQTYGPTAVDLAVRRLASRLRPKLPAGAAICRRDDCDFLVYLRGADEAFARSWANEAVSVASMTPITTPDGRTRIPLGLRAKVAPFAPQLNRISASKAS